MPGQGNAGDSPPGTSVGDGFPDQLGDINPSSANLVRVRRADVGVGAAEDVVEPQLAMVEVHVRGILAAQRAPGAAADPVIADTAVMRRRAGRR